MKLLIFGIYDSAVKAYNTPLFFRSRGEAIRSMMQACGDEKSNLRSFHQDYTLMYLGEFDDGPGSFAPCVPERVIGASECVDDDVTLTGSRPPGRLPM